MTHQKGQAVARYYIIEKQCFLERLYCRYDSGPDEDRFLREYGKYQTDDDLFFDE